MEIPMVDLKLHHQRLKSEIEEAIGQVVAGGQFILGPRVRRFEEKVASFIGVKHAVGVASGTDALRLALMASDIGPGDEVVTTPFSFIAAAEAIAAVGATPVFVDIDPSSLNLDPEKVKPAITRKTKALLPVHLFGRPVELASMAELCEQNGIRLIEDCAQSFGARYDGRMTGSWGDLGCFSFYPSKNLGGLGDGGMIVTDRDDLANRIRSLCNHGVREKYHHDRIGLNSRLDEIQAAVLLVKLQHIGRFNAARRDHAGHYSDLLAGSPLMPPTEDARGTHVFHQYTIRSEQRDRLQSRLTAAGIASAVYYPVPLHLQKTFSDIPAAGSLPAAEEASARVLSLPMFPELKKTQITLICRILLEALRG